AETMFSYCLELHEPDNPGYDLFPLMGLVDMYRFMGRYSEAEKAAKEIEEKIHQNEILKPYLYAVLSGLYIDMGQYERAKELIREAWEKDAQEGQGEIWIELQARLAWCYFQTGETDKAMECFNTALDLAEDKDVPYRENVVHSLLSMARIEYGSEEEALNHAQLAIEKAIDVNSELCIALAAESMGKTLGKTGKTGEGMEYLKHSLRVATKIGHQRYVCAALLAIARSHLESGRFRDAVKYGYRLLHHANHRLAPQRKEAMLIIARAYAQQGLKEEAVSLTKPVLEWSREAGVSKLAEEAGELMKNLAS
ncbi:tetratricopeptide repeat protein, partial [bacterium]